MEAVLLQARYRHLHQVHYRPVVARHSVLLHLRVVARQALRRRRVHQARQALVARRHPVVQVLAVRRVVARLPAALRVHPALRRLRVVARQAL